MVTPEGVFTGDEIVARRRAYRRGGVPVRETPSLCGKTVYVRRFDVSGPVAANVTIAQIVGENDNHVWRGGGECVAKRGVVNMECGNN